LKERVAKYISLVGHPLLTLSIFSTIVLFNNETIENAFFVSMIFFFCLIVPLLLNIYSGCQSGKYKDYDLSDKQERQTWYFYALSLLSFVTIIIFATGQPEIIRVNIVFAFLLLLASKITNYYIKSSLHVSFNVFLAFLIIPIQIELGLALLCFVVLIAWSRMKLERHTIMEVAIGAAIGILVGMGWLLSTYQSNLETILAQSNNIG
jgi:membrane-associated phospholipid phosphatase